MLQTIQTSLRKLAAIGVVGLLACATQNAQGGPKNRSRERPAKAWHGNEAVQKLGNRFATVAQRHGMALGELRNRFARDKHLWVDDNDELLYIDEFALPAKLSEESSIGDDPFATLPLDQTFVLHSNPGASKVIYLDFDGQVVSGTYWNSVYAGGAELVTEPFSLDADASTFSDSELAAIQQVFLRVAEDFRPYDVDVTTEEPVADALKRTDPSDAEFGIRVVVTPTDDWLGMAAGGISYVGSFAWTTDTPCFVFSAVLGNNARSIGEAASHETGHGLGLHHDGLTDGTVYYGGHADWAPIMGLSYYKTMTQWSRGDYLNADNQEDDLQVMTAYGVAFRADDHADTFAGATELIDSAVDVSGIITTADDVDVFSFAAGTGTVDLTAAPVAYAPNLNIRLDLYDNAGTLVASTDSPDTLGATVNVTVAAGTYYVVVDGVGSGDATTGYTDYASLGAYRITGTVPENVSLQSPVAVATAAPTSGVAPLTVYFDGSASSDPDGDVASYLWAFGDGTTSTAITGSHIYEAEGEYTASLTVTDADGLSDSTMLTISVQSPPNQPPVCVVSAEPVSGFAPLTVAFTGSNSYDPDGAVAHYHWDFGTGTSSTFPDPTYRYTMPGTYTASLLVTDDDGAQDIAAVIIEVAEPEPTPICVADIGMALTDAGAGHAAVASVLITDDAGSPVPGAVVTGAWGGLVSAVDTAQSDANGIALFTSAASTSEGVFEFAVQTVVLSGFEYTPELNAESSDSVANEVVPNSPPVAVIAVLPQDAQVGTSLTFDGSNSYDPDGSIVSYEWDFGDGATSDGATASHAYAAAGTYQVELTVVDERGAAAATTVPVTVSPVAAAPAAFVADISLSVARVWRKFFSAEAVVKVLAEDGTPVRRARVTAEWAGGARPRRSHGFTDDNGVAVLASPKAAPNSTLTFTVIDVRVRGMEYDPSLNIQTSDSISN